MRSTSSALLAASWTRRWPSRSTTRRMTLAKCADVTPGAPPSASTARPESSAIAAPPAARAAWRALASAFSTKVACGSSASSMPSAPCATSSMPSGANSSPSSASLPALLDARTSPRRDRQRRGERRSLRADQLADALGGEREQAVHLVARERRAFGGALHLDEAAGPGHDDVHVGVAARVLDVLEIEHRRAVDDADRDRRDEVADRRARELALPDQPRHRVVRGDEGAGDRGGTGAAVGLHDVAVERDGALAEGREVEHAAQRRGRSGAGSPACARSACRAPPRGRRAYAWSAAACRIRP